MGRVFEIKYKCGCLESLDGGGAVIDCCSKECLYRKVLEDGTKVTKEMEKKWDEECKRRNP